MIDFTQEEKELLEAYEKDEWKSIKGKRKEISRYQGIANATFKKDNRVNIRISSKDVHAIQVKALEEGIPYQTLIASILHKYVTGKLTEKSSSSRD
jgi:predicted DNA binding CopG/RHH family protein